MAAEPASESEALLSIRSSCDRCRLQKLKCLVQLSTDPPIGTSQCQRCARAKVPCVFGRRSKSTRTGSISNSNMKRSQRRTTTVPTTAVTLDTKSHNTSEKENPISTELRTPEDDGFSIDGSWGSTLDDSLVMDGMSGTQNHDENVYKYLFESDSTMESLHSFNNDMTHSSQCHGELSFADNMAGPTSINEEENSNIDASSARNTNFIISERGDAMRKLLNLASNFHERLEVLENGTWQQENSGQALDSYPIGSVLYLSQQFTRLVCSLRRVSSDDEINSASTSSGTWPSAFFDPSVTLMLSSCFVTLTRIYTIVLGHFQTHLNSQPCAGVGVWPLNVDIGPTLSLGQLPSTDTSWSRIYAAVRMLLESLSQAEEALGLPPQARCASGTQPVSSCITETKTFSDALMEPDMVIATSFQAEYTNLRRIVTDIKELLRQRMGL